jgi:hypothetical protein
LLFPTAPNAMASASGTTISPLSTWLS